MILHYAYGAIKLITFRYLCGTIQYNKIQHSTIRGPGSTVGIATELRAGRSGVEYRLGRDFPPLPDRPWGPPSLL